MQTADSASIAIVISLARPEGAFVCARAILERVKEQISAIDAEARAAAGDKRRSALEKAREKAASKLADHPDAKEKRILICGVSVSFARDRRPPLPSLLRATGAYRGDLHALRRRAAAGARGAESAG